MAVPDQFDSYDLSGVHKNRYFSPRVSIASLLKDVRKWTKKLEENGGAVSGVSVVNWFSDEKEDVVWEATVLYSEGW